MMLSGGLWLAGTALILALPAVSFSTFHLAFFIGHLNSQVLPDV
jgi:hypothetical protein